MNMKNTSTEYATMADLKEDLVALKTDFAKLLNGLAETGKAQAKESYQHGVESVNNFAERSQDTAKEAHKKLSLYVAERPITCLAIAAVVGAFLARCNSHK